MGTVPNSYQGRVQIIGELVVLGQLNGNWNRPQFRTSPLNATALNGNRNRPQFSTSPLNGNRNRPRFRTSPLTPAP